MTCDFLTLGNFKTCIWQVPVFDLMAAAIFLLLLIVLLVGMISCFWLFKDL